MLSEEQIQSMALSHGFYPDADFAELVRAIERAARAEVIEECAKVFDDLAAIHAKTGEEWSAEARREDAERIRALRGVKP
jgi:hypothetical protein